MLQREHCELPPDGRCLSLTGPVRHPRTAESVFIPPVRHPARTAPCTDRVTPTGRPGSDDRDARGVTAVPTGTLWPSRASHRVTTLSAGSVTAGVTVDPGSCDGRQMSVAGAVGTGRRPLQTPVCLRRGRLTPGAEPTPRGSRVKRVATRRRTDAAKRRQ